MAYGVLTEEEKERLALANILKDPNAGAQTELEAMRLNSPTGGSLITGVGSSIGSSSGLSGLGAKSLGENSMLMASFEEAGYPSNLSDEDKIFIMQRMMELGNFKNNPYLKGSTGLPMLFREKYGQ